MHIRTLPLLALLAAHAIAQQTPIPFAQPLTAGGGTCQLDAVVPSGFDDVPGGSNTSYPWNSTGAVRVMYAYGRESVDFDHPVRICGLRFRPQQGATSTAAVDYDFRLDVSTSRNAALDLDQTFNLNHGADQVTVFDGVLSQPANGALGQTPNPFILEVPFDEPFEWDPRSGPLLLDFRHRGASGLAGASWDISTTSEAGRILATTSANASTATFPGGSTQMAALVVELCLEADVVPSTLATAFGNSSSSYPWNRSSPMRVQYAYDASTVGFAGRHKIRELSFRTENAAAFVGNSYEMIVTMSTGANDVAALSSTFDDNHGDDKLVVFDGVHVAAPADGSLDPQWWNLTIPLQTPFEYNPANGPLVFDVQLLAGVTLGAGFDGAVGDPNARRLYNTTSASAATGTLQDFGLAVALTAEPIPTLPKFDDSSFGQTSSSFPWDVTGEQRIQYQYSPSTVEASGPLYIQHLSWRPNDGFVFGPVTYTCTIDLSTSSTAVGVLSPAFNNNHGNDRVRVFDGSFSVPYTPSTSDPNAFPITVKLDLPFYWDPDDGPLLVDIRMLDQNGFTNTCDGSFQPGLYRIAHLSNADANIADWPTSGNPQNFGIDMRLSGEDCNATSESFGVGCTGSGGLATCVNLNRPTLPNPAFTLAILDGPPTSFSFLALGLQQVSVPLDFAGAPGCTALSLAEVGAFPVLTDGSGYGEFSFPLPDDGAFTGFQFVTQWVSLDPVNGLGLSYSDAQLHTTCY